MSFFTSAKKKKFKRRQTLCEEADIFSQVHYIREHHNEKNRFNTLPHKSSPERDACVEWYSNHNNPSSYSQIVLCYLNDSKTDKDTLCEKYQLERTYFSKLADNPKYHPSKGEALILCFAFHLNYEEARALLKSADFILSSSEKQDLIIRYFLENNLFNLNDLNYVLNHFDFPSVKDII